MSASGASMLGHTSRASPSRVSTGSRSPRSRSPSPSRAPTRTSGGSPSHHSHVTRATYGANWNVAERMYAEGGVKSMTMREGDQAALLASVAKHFEALKQIPDFLPHLHVDYDAVEVRDSTVCDGKGVFAIRDIEPHELLTLYPASNELSLMRVEKASSKDGEKDEGAGGDDDGGAAEGVASTIKSETYVAPQPSYVMFNGHKMFGDGNALRLEADPGAPLVSGFLGHLVNDVLPPPTDATDAAYAGEYLKKTTNETNCHAVPFPSGIVAIAASKKIRAGEELLMTYSFGFDKSFMDGVNADVELKKKMLSNAFAADMKVLSVKMEQLTRESLKVHREAEILSRELLCDVAGE
ncbi:uncharacterized protein MICPUCDRAFT_53458 [Micromonas pusilla CCMP1545]|uniref:Predicted protein n=1 Tax=Micromonas pusilla (strain CCMP1545) TaxID=564608 RepID=C1N6V8_MICPC|nr:uncharacterized protein MICPUCDRAFT_53458 [Micromonas pusilla CCMP1545]EEH52172.1 predicted protein [Micromonas pusilla CCMP1545]|eukprot:XP_003063799.1 predicted protein [Micromonas pusilla CCMP1545]